MLQQLITALQNYWQTHFPTSVPTAFPGVPIPVGDATEWMEVWLDTLHSPPRRTTAPQRLDLLITVHCFSRHPHNKVAAQGLLDEACRLLVHRHIEIHNSSNDATPTGQLAIHEPQVRDLTRAEPPSAKPIQHLVLSLTATAQFCPSVLA